MSLGPSESVSRGRRSRQNGRPQERILTVGSWRVSRVDDLMEHSTRTGVGIDPSLPRPGSAAPGSMAQALRSAGSATRPSILGEAARR